jgi:hypothetical protein
MCWKLWKCSPHPPVGKTSQQSPRHSICPSKGERMCKCRSRAEGIPLPLVALLSSGDVQAAVEWPWWAKRGSIYAIPCTVETF